MASNRINSNELVKAFTASTAIDESLATYYLEQSGWNIEEAVNNFLDSHASAECEGSRDNPILIPDTPVNIPSDSAFDVGSASHVDVGQDWHQNLNLLSWNVDGLDERNIIERTRNVCHVINSRKPDVVFLQEVVCDSLPIFQSRSGYSCLYGSSQAYFNVMLIRNTSIKATDDLRCKFFQSSSMGRHVLQQSVLFNGKIHLVLMTSHFESTAQCAAERKKQLQLVLTYMNQEAMHANVIFGGDTNLRDKEILSIGGLPRGIVDAWEESGKPEDAKFTWDVSVNDNLDWKNRSKPRLRFDRMFLRPAQGPHAMKVVSLSLVGKERLPGCDRFASDHWGVWCEFAQLDD